VNRRNGETETFEDKETGRQGETVTCRTGRMNPMDWKRALRVLIPKGLEDNISCWKGARHKACRTGRELRWN
jgi:hypothetical protein